MTTTTKPMDDGGPAFPWGEHGTRLGGMSLRDAFALEAMGRAMDLSPPQWWNEGISPIRGTPEMDRVAKVAYAMADSMLRARQEKDHDR